MIVQQGRATGSRIAQLCIGSVLLIIGRHRIVWAYGNVLAGVHLDQKRARFLSFQTTFPGHFRVLLSPQTILFRYGEAIERAGV